LTDVRPSCTGAFSGNSTRWGDSWVDLENDGSAGLVLANGAIRVRLGLSDTSAREPTVRFPDGTIRRIQHPSVDRMLSITR
jgi:hypothetical protein